MGDQFNDRPWKDLEVGSPLAMGWGFPVNSQRRSNETH